MSGAMMGFFSGQSLPPVYLSYSARLGSNSFVAYPSGGGLGNLLLSVAWDSNAITWSSDSTTRINQGAVPSLYLGDELDAGAGPNNFTFTGSGSTAEAMAILRFANASFDVVGSIQTISADGTLTIPAITSSGGLLVAVCVGANGLTIGTPSGFTSALDTTVNGRQIAVFTKAVDAGSTGSVAVSVSGLGLNPAAGVLYGLK